ncbi:MAG TPA: hypothetical protein VIX17_11350 [Pyrinomonadaceae bacterium]
MATTPNFGWTIPDPAGSIYPQLRDVLMEIDAALALCCGGGFDVLGDDALSGALLDDSGSDRLTGI